MARFGRKKSLWTVVLVLVLLAVIGSVVALFVKLDKKETTKNIGVSVYKLGALDDNGLWTENEGSLVSGYIECDGLKVDVKDDATVEYRIYFYGEDKTYITDSATAFSQFDFNGDVATGAKFCRIVINPLEDSSIDVLEKIGYASQLTVTVNK